MASFRLVVSAIVIALLVQSCDNKGKGDIAANGKAEFADSAMSSVRIYADAQNRKVIQKNNTSYDIVDFTDRQDIKKLLLKVTKTETSFVDSGTAKNNFLVSVSGIGDSKVNWTKEFKGTDIDYTYKVLVVHTEGKSSDEEDTYTQYSMQTGQKLMSYTYSPLLAQIFNTSNKRFFGYLSQQSSTEEKPTKFATISFVGSNEVLDKVDIKVKDGNTFPPYTPEIGILAAKESGNTVAGEGKIVILAHTDRTFEAKDISGFAMKVTYTNPKGESIVVLLPVRDDHIDLANASYDKDIFEITKAD